MCFRKGVLAVALILNFQFTICANRQFSSEKWIVEDEPEGVYHIIGGENAKRAAPYMVTIQDNEDRSQICSGSIVSSSHVVTAAHCFKGYNDDELMVVVGTHTNRNVEDYDIEYVFIHPEFTDSANDIAVVKVHSKFDFAKRTVKPIKLGRSYLAANVLVMTTGWGVTNYDPPTYPTEMQVMYETTLSNAECAKFWRRPIIKTEFCSYNTSRTCIGDSGGPVVTANTREPLLVGVVAYGKRGCKNKTPNVRTRISSHLAFIENAMRNIDIEY